MLACWASRWMVRINLWIDNQGCSGSAPVLDTALGRLPGFLHLMHGVCEHTKDKDIEERLRRERHVVVVLNGVEETKEVKVRRRRKFPPNI